MSKTQTAPTRKPRTAKPTPESDVELPVLNNDTGEEIKPLCRCGCGLTTRRFFVQGHDARAYGRVLRGELPLSVLDGCPGLLSKFEFARRSSDKIEAGANKVENLAANLKLAAHKG